MLFMQLCGNMNSWLVELNVDIIGKKAGEPSEVFIFIICS
jgi:hypothetical protein